LTLADDRPQRCRGHRHISRLLVIACVLAGVKFVARGPARVRRVREILRRFISVARGLHRLDPYDYAVVGWMWIDAGRETKQRPCAGARPRCIHRPLSRFWLQWPPYHGGLRNQPMYLTQSAG